jgi:putative transposase
VKKTRLSVEQMTAVLPQVSGGVPVGDVCRQVGISEQTLYRWMKTDGGIQPRDARELKQGREEDAKLKRLVADLSLDTVMLQDVLHKDPNARETARSQAPPHGPLVHPVHRAGAVFG